MPYTQRQSIQSTTITPREPPTQRRPFKGYCLPFLVKSWVGLFGVGVRHVVPSRHGIECRHVDDRQRLRCSRWLVVFFNLEKRLLCSSMLFAFFPEKESPPESGGGSFYRILTSFSAALLCVLPTGQMLVVLCHWRCNPSPHDTQP